MIWLPKGAKAPAFFYRGLSKNSGQATGQARGGQTYKMLAQMFPHSSDQKNKTNDVWCATNKPEEITAR